MKKGETMVGNSGPGNSERARRYRENDIGVETDGGERWDTLPRQQSPESLERALPSENPESLVSDGDAASRRVGKNSLL